MKWSFDTVKNLVKKVIHSDGEPGRIASAVAVGVFIAWFPIVGTHTVMAIGAAWIFRLSTALVFVGNFLNNPFTMIPMFLSGFWVGLAVTGTEDVSIDWTMNMETLIEIGKVFFIPFCIGNILLGIVGGVITYFLILHAVRKYRALHAAQLNEENRA
ncbi:MAG: DUF2062 domain-containing protein [Nitrospinota bacterium]|nr:DUF2062 domain-containing protein [Nitrospinota bacterium]